MQAFIRTKVRIPNVPVDFVNRARLVQLLQSGLSHRLTLVVAPAGYGKTSLIAHWLTTCPPTDGYVPVWYSLDAGDNHLDTFLTYLAQALIAAGFDLDASILPMLASGKVDADELSQAFLSACTAAQRHALIVLDDYHLITAPAVHALIHNLIRYAAHTLHLVLITRVDPPLNTARLRAHDEIMEVRVQDLRFNRSEAADLLHTLLGDAPTAQMIEALCTQTEGWVVGLQLSAIAMREHGDIARFVYNIQQNTNMFVIDYLMDEVLATQPAHVRDFLLKTSLLDRFSVPLAAAVTGLDRAATAQIVAQLRQNNLFVVSLDEQHEWMRYHPQFQEMLRHRLRAQLDNDARHALHAVAADWLADQGRLDDALTHFAACQAWETATHHLAQIVPTCQNTEQFHILDRWLSRIPQPIIRQRPVLLIAQIWLLVERDALDAARPLLALVRQHLTHPEAGPVPAAVLGEFHALLALGIDPTLSTAERQEYAHRALAQIPPTSTWVRSMAYYAHAMILAGQGHADNAVHELTAVIRSADLNDPMLVVRLLTTQLQTLLYAGRVDKLSHVAHRLARLAQRHDLRHSVAWANYALAYVAGEQGDPARAYHLLSPLVDKQTTADFYCRVLALERLITTAATLDLLPEVIAQIHALIQHNKRSVSVHRLEILEALLAYANLMAGNRHLARQWLTATGVKAESIARSWQIVRQIQATILLAEGIEHNLAHNVARATKMLCQQLRTVQERHAVFRAVPLTLLLARAYQTAGQHDAAPAALQQAIALGYPHGYRYSFLTQGPAITALLHKLARHTRHHQTLAPPPHTDVHAAARALLGLVPATPTAPSTTAPSTALPFTASPVTVRATPAARHTAPIEPLTQREEEVLTLLGKRLTNKEIAHRLGVSPLTVRNHASRLYRKLGVTGRKDAVRLGHTLGLLAQGSQPPPRPSLDEVMGY